MSSPAMKVPPDEPKGLLDVWRDLNLPADWRAEIVRDGTITVTPPVTLPHDVIADIVNRALVLGTTADWGIFQTLGLVRPDSEKVYLPDLVVVREDDLPQGDATLVPAKRATLVVEITSKDDADDDRTFKRRGYAAVSIPLYLMIDRWAKPGPSVTLFSEPADGDYQRRLQVPFGDTVELPEPFAIETTEFPAR
jgi:Uma2 family endonuclease